MSLKEAPRFDQLPSSSPELNYGPFSEQPEYIEVNRKLVKSFISRLPSRFIHVDIATGTGLVPKLTIEEAQRTNKRGEIFGIDPNTDSLEIARRTTPGTSDISVDFIEGYGQNLEQLLAGKIPQEGVDGVSILDALHEIRDDEDKQTVLNSMTAILKPGGALIFNSAFTTEAICESPRDWASWKLAAMNILKGTRDKQAPTITIHSPEKYRQMIEETGLKVAHQTTTIVMLSRKALEAISQYPAFIRGVFEDMKGQEQVPVEDKSKALIEALRQRNVVVIPRAWFEIIAHKPSPYTTSLT